MTEQQLDRKDLKAQALRERLAQVTVEGEDRAADLRVELTLVSQEASRLQDRVNELEAQLASADVQEDAEAK